MLATSKILRYVLSILIRLLDYAFLSAMEVVWLPLIAATVLGNVIVTDGAARLLPFPRRPLIRLRLFGNLASASRSTKIPA